MDKKELLQKVKQVYKKSYKGNAFQNAVLNHDYLKNIGLEVQKHYKIDNNYCCYFIAGHKKLNVIILYRNRQISTKKFLIKMEV